MVRPGRRVATGHLLDGLPRQAARTTPTCEQQHPAAQQPPQAPHGQRRSGARNITPRSPEGGGTRVRRFAIDGSPLIELPQRETGRAG